MTLEKLKQKIQAMEISIPLSERVDILGAPLALDPVTLRNRLAIQPMEGCDGTPDGQPDELTRRRYLRFAQSGVGLLWFEATAVVPEGRASPRQLLINERTLGSLQRLVELIKETALTETGFAPLLILQATHSGRYSKPEGIPSPIVAYHNPNREGKCRVITDDELKALEETYAEAARLAASAGFNGIDVKSCHGYLCNELLSAYTRRGEYGETFENRTKFLVNSVKAARANAPTDFIVTSRLNVYDGFAWPYGFGADENMEEPLRLVGILHNQLGMNLLNITMGCPYVNPHVNRPYDRGPYEPPEQPLAGVERMVRLTGQVQRAYPGLAVLGSGPTYLRQFGANLAAGAVEHGDCKLMGFGRQAFAYPGFARDILQSGRLGPGKCCIACGKCSELMRAGSTAGCAVRDGSTYLPIYERDVLGKK